MIQTMKEMPEAERPYEKCIREGESSLSDSELLAVILRCGTRGSSSLALANEFSASGFYCGLLYGKITASGTGADDLYDAG